MKSATVILEHSPLGANPAYYSGRGETTSDLNGQKLEQILKDVQESNGKDAANNFVNMVADLYFTLQDLSASRFINAFYDLERLGWKHSLAVMPKSEEGNLLETARREQEITGKLESTRFTVSRMCHGFAGKRKDRERQIIAQEFLVTHADMIKGNNLSLLQEEVKNKPQYAHIMALVS